MQEEERNKAHAVVEVPALQGPIPETADSIAWNSVSKQTTPIDLAAIGYIEEEYFISGKVNVYQWDQPGPAKVRTPDVPYCNRIIVRRPLEIAQASGNVFVEIINSTSTYDSTPLWYASHDKFLRDGDIYIGMTSKPIAIQALKRYHPVRYAALSWANPLPEEKRGSTPGDYMPPGIPGSFPESEDGLVWDMISQVVALIRSDRGTNPLKNLKVEKVYGIGASQSALILTTYINAFHRCVTIQSHSGPVFDGYLLTVGAYPLPIHQEAEVLFPSGDLRIPICHCNVPVIRIMSESDFRSMGPWPFLEARRKDSDALEDRFRLYEIPGSCHTNYYTIQFRSNQDQLAIIGQATASTSEYIPNDLPSQYIFNGALVNLDLWVRNGTLPPKAPWIELDSTIEKDAFGNLVPVIQRDQFGNALGGLRMPYLDVPIATYTMNAPDNPLLGQKVPFTTELLQRLYGSKEQYFEHVTQKVDELVEKRFLTVVDGEKWKRDIAALTKF